MKNKIIIFVVLIIFVLIAFALTQNFVLNCKLSFLKSLSICQPYGAEETQTPPPGTSANAPKPQKISLPKILYNLAGSIQEIGQNFVLLDASIPQMDDLGQPIIKKEMRKVLTTLTTKFTRLNFVETPGSSSRSPQETSIGFKDLKKGDYVEAVSNQDITAKQEFEATLIRVLQKNL